MPYAPSRGLERLAESLVPPACVEHVLGDLAESSDARSAYLRSLVSVVPSVVWSQVRRRATFGGIAFNAVITGTTLLIFLGFSSPAGSGSGLRVAAPWAIWVVGCALAAAFGPRDKPRAWNRTGCIATALASLGAAVIAGLPVIIVALALSAVGGSLLLLSWQLRKHAPPPPLSLDTIGAHARFFQNRIRLRNLCESIAGIIVFAANLRDLGHAQTSLARASHWVLMIGVFFVIAFLNSRARARQVPIGGDVPTILRFHRDEMARQRDLLRLVPWWYLGPFVPGMLLMLAARWQTSAAAVLVGLPVIGGVFLFVWWLNVRGALLLDGEIHRVNALEGKL